jgi:hypothetical protein
MISKETLEYSRFNGGLTSLWGGVCKYIRIVLNNGLKTHYIVLNIRS